MITGIRMGFATNSSSSHSIVVVGGSKISDDLCCEDFEYGWENFSLRSRNEKMKYLASSLYSFLMRKGMKKEECLSIAEELTGSGIKEYKGDYGPYVDHQSGICDIHPFNNREEIDIEFFESFRDYISREEIAILGGNDNNFRGIAPGSRISIASKILDEGERIISRSDGKGRWTLFNERTGAKVRFDFGGDEIEKSDFRPSSPELVDIKITDFCSFGCPFCYQGSTKNGRHAEFSTIRKILEILGRMRIFEVALGGGETTEHPDFTKILLSAREFGIVPNFTTKSLDWSSDNNISETVKNVAGGFAFSVSSKKEMEDAVNAFSDPGLSRKMGFQIVMGVQSEEELRDQIDFASSIYKGVTLLGYKTTGRGSEFKPMDYGGWIKIVKDSNNGFLRIGIDTALAHEYNLELNKWGINDLLYSTKEGTHSMYIDAVEMECGPSSYCDKSDMSRVDLENIKRSIQESWISIGEDL